MFQESQSSGSSSSGVCVLVVSIRSPSSTSVGRSYSTKQAFFRIGLVVHICKWSIAGVKRQKGLKKIHALLIFLP